jgi:hypothetical protein
MCHVPVDFLLTIYRPNEEPCSRVASAATAPEAIALAFCLAKEVR